MSSQAVCRQLVQSVIPTPVQTTELACNHKADGPIWMWPCDHAAHRVDIYYVEKQPQTAIVLHPPPYCMLLSGIQLLMGCYCAAKLVHDEKRAALALLHYLP